MYTEIEAKLKVDSLPDVAGRLGKVGAEFLEEQVQKDYYFDEHFTTNPKDVEVEKK